MKSKLKSKAKLKSGEFKFKATVVRGDGRGRKIGFPTINVEAEDKSFERLGEHFLRFFSNSSKDESVYGVYLVKANGMPAVMHFGPLPTFEKNIPRAEIHILNFEGDLYGREVELEVFEKIREVEKFDSVEDLIAAIECDVNKARQFFGIDSKN